MTDKPDPNEVEMLRSQLGNIETYKNLRNLVIDARRGDRQSQHMIIETVSIILKEGQPMEKLLSVRLIKDVMDSRQPEFVALVKQYLLTDYETVACHRARDPDMRRGKDIFNSNPSKEQSQIGNSFFLMVLESVQVWAQWFPNSEYSDVYETSLHKGVTYPSVLKYYSQGAHTAGSQILSSRMLGTATKEKEGPFSSEHVISALQKEREFLADIFSKDRLEKDDIAGLNETYLNVKNALVTYPNLHLPTNLEFFRQYLKDYESYVRQEVTFKELKGVYQKIFNDIKTENSVESEQVDVRVHNLQGQPSSIHHRAVNKHINDISLDMVQELTATAPNYSPLMRKSGYKVVASQAHDVPGLLKQNQDLQAQLGQMNSQHGRLLQQLQEQQDISQRLDRQILVQQSQIQEFQRIVEMLGEPAEQFNDLKQQHKFAQDEFSFKLLEQSNQHLEEKKKQLAEIRHLQQLMDTSERVSQEARKALADTHKSYSNIVEQSKSQANQVLGLNSENINLKSQIVQLKLLINSLQQQLEQQKEDFTSKRQDRNILDLRSQIEDHEKHNKLYVMQLEQLNTLQREHEELTIHCREIEKQKVQLLEENIRLRASMKEHSQQKQRVSPRIFENNARLTTPDRMRVLEVPAVRVPLGKQEQYSPAQKSATMASKHSQIIYPYTNPLDYYRDKIQKPSKGSEVAPVPWLPENIDKNYLTNYKNCCLEQERTLCDNHFFSIASLITPLMLNGQRHLTLQLKIQSKLVHPSSIGLHFQFPKELYVQGDVDDRTTQLAKLQPLVLTIQASLVASPITPSLLFIDLNTGISPQKIKTYLPITLVHFFEFVKIDVAHFKLKWSNHATNIHRSRIFKYNEAMLKQAGDIQRYIGDLVVLNAHKLEEYVTGIDELKFGGLWALPGEMLLVKLTFTPLKEMIIQVLQLDVHQNIRLIESVINVLWFYFAN